MVETPAAAESVQTPEHWVSAELAKAQAVDPELAMICGWRLDSEDPLHGVTSLNIAKRPRPIGPMGPVRAKCVWEGMSCTESG